jgi:hypothetical protein
MRQIDAILDLIQTAYPNEEGAPVSFRLQLVEGVWTARVEVSVKGRVVWDEAKGTTADEALDRLYRKMVTFNRSVLARIQNRLARWVGGKPVLIIPSEKSSKEA